MLAKVLLKQETFQRGEWRQLMEENPSTFDVAGLPMFNKPKKNLEL